MIVISCEEGLLKVIGNEIGDPSLLEASPIVIVGAGSLSIIVPIAVSFIFIVSVYVVVIATLKVSSVSSIVSAVVCTVKEDEVVLAGIVIVTGVVV